MELRDQDGTLLMAVGKTGGPAFPANHFDLTDEEHGMTMRDYFAAKAMQAVPMPQSALHDVQAGYDRIASHAYKMADAMLKARTA